MPANFNWRLVERKWQRKWAWSRIHEAEPSQGKPKYFVTAAYPYPNSPQHVGHGRTYTIADVNARFHRMQGFTTLYPMGFQYTGTPIFAMCKRLKQNDPEIIKAFIQTYNVPESILERLKDPVQMARYFHREIKKGMEEIGFSIDWRREFTTIDPVYTRFIEWHFNKLRQKGLITRGKHPVGWCPNDNGPVGQHDTEGDVEPEIGEFYLVKFQKDGTYYPTATLRPETVFGVTNVWVNPYVSYVQASVDGESWVVSREAAEKLRHQNHTVEVEKEIMGKDILWMNVYNPATQTTIPILPGEFVEAGNGTGVVMSVPGHAPYDYQALLDLKSQRELPNEIVERIRTIEPLSIISLEGSSDLPAADAVKKHRIESQKDPRLEEATREVYTGEFHRGIMKKNTGAYAGMPVAKARDAVVQEFTATGTFTRIFEILNRPVLCRCGAECLVHTVENQWFINYGDAEWKKLAHQCLDQMTLLPEESRKEYNYTIDWLREKACARKVGLGTRLPWDKDWVIESLSDSVVYMAYYVLAKFLSKNWIAFKKFEKDPGKLADSFFDYIFLGSGSLQSVNRETGIPARLVEAIRREFLYFYPVDMRHSAKDLIPNHLTFYVFNHAILFPPDQWPKGIVASGFVMMEGMKMSKSIQNIIPLRQGVAKYGADPVRIGVLATAELSQDTDFSETLVASIQERLSSLVAQARKLRGKPEKRNLSPLDHWMLSRLNRSVQEATKSMEKLRVREVINRVLYHLDNDLAWYQRRMAQRRAKADGSVYVLRTVMKTRARLLAPLAPHTAEEMWSVLGNKGLVAKAKWPEPSDKFNDSRAEQAESLVRQTLEDTGEILKTTGIKPKRVVYYAATLWKWRIFLSALKATEAGRVDRGQFVNSVMSDLELRRLGKWAADYSAKAIQQVQQMAEDQRKVRVQMGQVQEKDVLAGAVEFFEQELRSPVFVWMEGDRDIDDPKGRSRLAEPYRPAIFIDPVTS